MSDPGRPFRDEGAAALERVAQLEEENAKLRAEVRLAHEAARAADVRARVRPTARSSRSLGGTFIAIAALGALGAVLAFASALTFLARRSEIAVHEVVVVSPPETASTTYADPMPPAPIEIAPVQGGEPGCVPPYTIDANGRKKYKPQCLGGPSARSSGAGAYAPKP